MRQPPPPALPRSATSPAGSGGGSNGDRTGLTPLPRSLPGEVPRGSASGGGGERKEDAAAAPTRFAALSHLPRWERGRVVFCGMCARGSVRAARPMRREVAPSARASAAAVDLRKRASMPERVLWNLLKRLRERGVVFRRQHPLGPFVADFYCHAAALVVEVDGKWSHGRGIGGDDRARDRWMHSRGIEVVRVSAGRLPKDRAVIADHIVRLAGGRAQELSRR